MEVKESILSLIDRELNGQVAFIALLEVKIEAQLVGVNFGDDNISGRSFDVAQVMSVWVCEVGVEDSGLHKDK